MTSTRTKKVTQAQAERVLAAVKIQCAGWFDPEYPEQGPKIVMDWRYLDDDGVPSIVWEEGPFEWSYRFPYGGIEEEFGFTVKDVSDKIPNGIHVESATSWALSLYRD